MNDELLLLIPTLLLGLTMAFEIVWVWSARGRVERDMKNLDDLIERLKEMEYKGPERKLTKFQVGDVVTVRKEAEEYGVTVLKYELIVSDILANGMIKVYAPLSNGGRSAEIVYNPEWLELVRRQGLDIPGTEKPESVKPKFEVGDTVIGNEKANKYYATNQGRVCIVDKILENGKIKVHIPLKDGSRSTSLTVDADCFDLVEHGEKKQSKFRVGDIVVGNEKAKGYAITTTGFPGIVTAIEDDGLMVIKGLNYPNLSYTVKQECFDLFGEQQTVDTPETEKPESIMERWANESKNFSETLKNLLKEFGFASTYEVKYQILSAFSEKYIKLFDKLGTNSCNPDDISVIRLAKALLVVSAYLETDNIEEVIDWADRK